MLSMRLFLLFLGVLNFLALLLSNKAVPSERVRPRFFDACCGAGVLKTESEGGWFSVLSDLVPYSSLSGKDWVTPDMNIHTNSCTKGVNGKPDEPVVVHSRSKK